MPKKRLLIGSDNFKKMITRNGYYVDKTLLVKEVLDNSTETVVITRPRRFGKSLNMSMLRYFFDKDESDTAPLFHPYKIWQAGETYTEQQGKYPVIFVSFKNVDASSFEEAMSDLRFLMADLYYSKNYLLGSPALTKGQKEHFEALMDANASAPMLKHSLKWLSQYLYRHHQQKVIILIDEYDNPILESYYEGFYDTMIKFMRGFLGGALKSNDALEKGVVTGILRISKESIFSKLNNLGVYTPLDYEFADKFGFLESELQDMLTYFGLSERQKAIKAWYDGYQIGNVVDLYNPWSICSFVSKHQQGLRPYWVQTSSDSLIQQRIIKEDSVQLRQDLHLLMEGQTIYKRVHTETIFKDLNLSYKANTIELLWSLLLFTGYLTLDEAPYGTQQTNALRIPNKELETVFQNVVLGWLNITFAIPYDALLQLAQCLRDHDLDHLQERLTAAMGDTASYYDLNMKSEQVYHVYLLGLLAIAKGDFIIQSNREAGKGRYDILMMPRAKDGIGFIMEIKALDKKAKAKQIDAALAKAITQIQQNNYQQALKTHGIQRCTAIGIVFVRKEIYVKCKTI